MMHRYIRTLKSKFLLCGAALVVGTMAGCSHSSKDSLADDTGMGRNSTDYAHHVGAEVMYSDNVEQAKSAIQANPNNVDARMALADKYMGTDWPKATEQLREVLRVQPNNRKAMSLLAVSLQRTGHADEAKSLYQKLETQDDMWGQSAKRRLQRMAGN